VRIDGVIDAADQLLMVRHLRGEAALTPEQHAAGDLAPYASSSGSVIGDGAVTAADVAVLARVLAGEDVDGDGLGTRMEARLELSPFARDTDGDGIADGAEDADQDGLSSQDEILSGTDPANPDTDGDGLVDGEDDAPLAHAGVEVAFVHADPLGSTAVLTDGNATLIRRTRYGIFGELRSNDRLGPPGTLDPAHKYTGARFDPHLGLADHGARWYDAELAVWTQPDPIVADAYDPQNLNRFGYVRGDPLTLIDPTGAYAEVPTWPVPRPRDFFINSWGYRLWQRFNFWFARQLQRPQAVTFQTYSQLSVGRTTVRMGSLREMQALLRQVKADRAGVTARRDPALQLAIDQLNKYNSPSVEFDAEYQGFVFRRADGSLGTTPALRTQCLGAVCGGTYNDAIDLVPSDASPVYHWHTHGRAPETNPMAYRLFSQGDVEVINELGNINSAFLGGVVGTPSGRAYLLRPNVVPESPYDPRAVAAAQEYLGRVRH
jgi:RHS repeat-associated protein